MAIKKRYQKKTKVDFGSLQILTMRAKYPNFKVKRHTSDSIVFEGELFIKPEMPIYKISITYRGNSRPFARVLSPTLVDIPPHFYHETKSLCLYHPDDFKWSESKLIARDIVPWVAAWIYFYELWLEHGEWYGPEAKHTTNTKKK